MINTDKNFDILRSIVTTNVIDAEVEGPNPEFFEQVTHFFGTPTDDGESEGALIDRIMTYPENIIRNFLKSI